MEQLFAGPFRPKQFTLLLPSRKILRHTCQRSYVNLKISQAKTFQSVNQKCTFMQVKQLKKEYKAVRKLLLMSSTIDCLPSRSSLGNYRFYSTEKDEAKKNENKNEDKNKNEDEKKKDDGKKTDEDKKHVNTTELLRITNSLDFWIAFLISIVMSWFLSGPKPEGKTVKYEEFVNDYLMKGRVSHVTIYAGRDGRAVERPQATLYPVKYKNMADEKLNIELASHGFEKKLRQLESDLNVQKTESIPVNYSDKVLLTEREHQLLRIIAAFYVFSTVWIFMRLRKFVTRSKDKVPKDSTVEKLWDGSIMSESFSLTRGDKLMKEKMTFKDVAGLHEAKTEVFEFVKYLKNRDLVQKLGARPPTGALLLGPPGCGKTLLAKALASECDVPFYYMAATEFMDMFVGAGASKVRKLFQNARENAPCIIYIDEIDAIGRVRGQSNQSDEQLLNQLLTELDGMNERKDVIILASTNRADVLDKALLRPGRFDRHIMIDLPTLLERTELFELYLNKLKLKSPVSTYANKLAKLTPGMSGADISNICNEAAIHAARVGNTEVSASDFEFAIERIIAGAAKSTNTLTYGDKKVIAYHEAGHAVVGWLLEHTDALLKVTIVPRTTNILGFAQYLPKENQLYSNEQLFEMMCMALGGRVAESVIFNSITNGAQDDLTRVTKIAYAQIKTYGMSKTVGLLSFPLDDDMGIRPFSKKYQNMIDIEAQQLVGQAYRRTEKIIQENVDKLHKVANLLLEKETISASQIEELIGPPPFGKKNMIDPETLYDDEVAESLSPSKPKDTTKSV